MRALHRLRGEDDVVEGGELARHGRLLFGPEGLESLQIFAGDAPAGVEVGGADGLELLAQPARADTEVDAPAGEHVHGRDRLGREHRRAVRARP